MKLLAKMFALVADKFQNRTDKQGLPYILHCIYVMQHCGLTDEVSLCIALGHDLIEDTDVTTDYPQEHFGLEIALGIFALTNVGFDSYDEYIKSVAHSVMVEKLVKIKLADLQHNTQVSRLKGLAKADFDRIEKYQRAYTYLSKL